MQSTISAKKYTYFADLCWSKHAIPEHYHHEQFNLLHSIAVRDAWSEPHTEEEEIDNDLQKIELRTPKIERNLLKINIGRLEKHFKNTDWSFFSRTIEWYIIATPHSSKTHSKSNSELVTPSCTNILGNIIPVKHVQFFFQNITRALIYANVLKRKASTYIILCTYMDTYFGTNLKVNLNLINFNTTEWFELI